MNPLRVLSIWTRLTSTMPMPRTSSWTSQRSSPPGVKNPSMPVVFVCHTGHGVYAAARTEAAWRDVAPEAELVDDVERVAQVGGRSGGRDVADPDPIERTGERRVQRTVPADQPAEGAGARQERPVLDDRGTGQREPDPKLTRVASTPPTMVKRAFPSYGRPGRSWTRASRMLPQYGTLCGSVVEGGVPHDRTARIRPMTGVPHGLRNAPRSTDSGAA